EANPADARGQALEANAPARHVEPVMEMGVAGHQLLDLRVGPEDVVRIARQRRPAEWTDAAAEERANVGGHEAREVERVLDALLERHLANVVAVVDGWCARSVKCEHRPHMFGHRRFGRALDALGVALAALLPLLEGPPLGQVAV